jgi:hypothetical protein
MLQLNLPEHIQAELESAAASQGRTPEQFLEEIVVAHLEQEFPAPENFTDAEIARFKRSIAQLDRGERVSSEQVDAFFADWFKEIEAR